MRPEAELLKDVPLFQFLAERSVVQRTADRIAAMERVRADIEYDVNLKAELEIAHLHEKLNRLTSDVLVRLEQLSRVPPNDTIPNVHATPLAPLTIKHMQAHVKVPDRPKCAKPLS